jgi:AraC family transcriptional regulator, alkane utilization regulator
MDALTEVFKSIHFESTACYRVELSAPWEMQMAALNGAIFLVVVRGSVWLEVEGIETQIPLVGGDVVLLSKGQSHTLRDSHSKTLLDRLNNPVLEFDRLLEKHTVDSPNILHIGGGGLPTTVIYGRFCFTPLSENPLFSALPPLPIVKGEDRRNVEWLDTTLQFIASEIALPRPGAEIVIDRLANILLVQIVRAYIANQESGDRCWLRALINPYIGAALNLIHRYPDRAWTIEQLAKRVGISRTTFFTQFRELVGEPPNKYLTRWRIQRASQFLRLKKMTIAEVANLVGYESEASFSKAFKQWTGLSPWAYRQAK